jgi:hypothetical protein
MTQVQWTQLYLHPKVHRSYPSFLRCQSVSATEILSILATHHSPMRAAPIPTRSRSSTTSGVPSSRSGNAPSHIALPAVPHSSSWTSNAFAAFGNGGSTSGSARGSPGTPGSAPGTPSAELGPSAGTPGRTAESRTEQQRPVTSPTSPRAGFLPNLIQRTRARSSTLSGRRNQGQANPLQNAANQGLSPSQSGNQPQGSMAAPNGVNGSRRGTPVLTRSVSTPQQGCELSVSSLRITNTVDLTLYFAVQSTLMRLLQTSRPPRPILHLQAQHSASALSRTSKHTAHYTLNPSSATCSPVQAQIDSMVQFSKSDDSQKSKVKRCSSNSNSKAPEQTMLHIRRR